MIQNVGGSHESRRSVQFTPYPFFMGGCLPHLIQSFPFITNYFRASPGNQKVRSLAEPLITICLRLQFQRFQSRTETYLFSCPYPCKRGNGEERERAGVWMLSEARPMGTTGQEPTHFFIGLLTIWTFNNFAQSYKIFNGCDFCYTPVICR